MPTPKGGPKYPGPWENQINNEGVLCTTEGMTLEHISIAEGDAITLVPYLWRDGWFITTVKNSWQKILEAYL